MHKLFCVSKACPNLFISDFIMIEERDSLNANLSTVSKKLAVMTEERDLLRANFSENLKELEVLLSSLSESFYLPLSLQWFNSLANTVLFFSHWEET